jgi:hypothetical protein
VRPLFPQVLEDPGEQLGQSLQSRGQQHVDVASLRHTLAVLAELGQAAVTLYDRDPLEPLRQDCSARQSRQAATKHDRVLTDPRHGRLARARALRCRRGGRSRVGAIASAIS